MNYIPLLGRTLFAVIFLISASGHFSPECIQFAAAKVVPLASVAVPLSGVVAALGAISLSIGYKARWGAWLLVLFLLPVTFAMHNFWTIADPQAMHLDMVHFFKNLSMLGAALMITHFGAGP